MSYLIVAPEAMTAAAGDLAGIGSSVAAANAAAAGPTTAMLTAAADEVSTAIAAFFSAHAADYQRLAGQAAALHTQLERVLSAGAVAYAAAETTGTSPLQLAINAVSAPAQSLLARPIIGNGANATTLGGNGGDGGTRPKGTLFFRSGGDGGFGGWGGNGYGGVGGGNGGAGGTAYTSGGVYAGGPVQPGTEGTGPSGDHGGFGGSGGIGGHGGQAP